MIKFTIILLYLFSIFLISIVFKKYNEDSREIVRKIIHIGIGPLIPIAQFLKIAQNSALIFTGIVSLMVLINYTYKLFPTIEDVERKSFGKFFYCLSLFILISQSAPCASLDAHARGEEDRSTLGELIPDPNCEEPMEGMDRTIQKEHLGGWLSQLNEREQKIMRLRFGLDGEEPLTLAEIGRQINVSRERVRQLEAKAILKLRVMTTHQKAA